MTRAFPQDKRDVPAAARLVMLSERDINDASRLLAMLVRDPPSEALSMGGLQGPVGHEALIEAARDELKQRNRRSQLLPEGLFGEPAWEILLLLYAEQGRMRLTIARVSAILRTAPTTVLRWLSYLQDRELIVRQNHPTDLRAVFVELTEKAHEALGAYLTEKLARRT